jgi:hypothetical protein
VAGLVEADKATYSLKAVLLSWRSILLGSPGLFWRDKMLRQLSTTKGKELGLMKGATCQQDKL